MDMRTLYGKGARRLLREADARPGTLVMCVVPLPTFAPNPLRDAWGLVENWPALLRVVAPVALLRAAVTPQA